MNKTSIITASQNAFHQLTEKGFETSESDFFENPDGKWSVAENIQHLILATGTSTLAFQLPRFLLRLTGGKPNRNSRTYEEMLVKYQAKLNNGGKVSKRYVPRDQVPSQNEKESLKKSILYKWNKVSSNFIFALTTGRSEEDLDNYLIKHPLLGRITLRELGYFTIFHTLHHLESIKKITSKK